MVSTVTTMTFLAGQVIAMRLIACCRVSNDPMLHEIQRAAMSIGPGSDARWSDALIVGQWFRVKVDPGPDSGAFGLLVRPGLKSEGAVECDPGRGGLLV